MSRSGWTSSDYVLTSELTSSGKRYIANCVRVPRPIEKMRNHKCSFDRAYSKEKVIIPSSPWGISNPLAVYEPNARIRVYHDLEFYGDFVFYKITFCIWSLTSISVIISACGQALTHCPSPPQGRFNGAEYVQLAWRHKQLVSL